MKTFKNIILKVFPIFVFIFMVACNSEEEKFSEKDSYLYIWNVRCWSIGSTSTMEDIKVTYSFMGDTARVKQINFWIIKQNATLYADDAMKHQDRAFQLKRIVNDPDKKAYPKQCSFRFDGTISTDYDGDPIKVGEMYRFVVKAIGTDGMIVDSPTIESGLFEVFNPNPEKEK